MHAWVCDNPIGVDALQWRELPTPKPGLGEVLLEVKAASLNFPDILMVENKYQFKPPLPFTPGIEYAGVITAVGEGVTQFKVGQSVAARSGSGGFGTHAVTSASLCVAMPDAFTHVHAAAFFVTYGTSHHALMDRGELKPGETVLVLGAAGGVGSAAVEIAKVAGAKVIAAASSDEKCEMCKSLGADATINYGDATDPEAFRAALREALAGTDLDVIYDPMGGALAEPAFRSIAWRGRYLVVGFAAGAIPKIPLNLPLLKGASIVGVVWGGHVRKDPQGSAAVVEELAQWYAQGKLKPVIDRVLPMSDLKAAYALLATRRVLGKMVVVN